MASKRTLEERLQEKEAQWQKAIAKAKQYENQKKQLAQLKNAEDRKMRNHRLIEIGACAESVLGRSFVEGDNIRFLNFLKQQEKNGRFFTKAMNKSLLEERTPADATAITCEARKTAGTETAGDAADKG